MDPEHDIAAILHDGAKEGAKEATIRWIDRRMILLYLFVVAIACGVWKQNHDYSDTVQHRIEQHICVVLIPLLPKSPTEIPSTGYGSRVMTGVKQGARLNHCVTPPLPRPPKRS